MELREIIKETIAAHDQAEILEKTVSAAIVDGRFKMTLADHRKFRDLIDDAEIILNRAWRGSMQIPLELPKVAGNK